MNSVAMTPEVVTGNDAEVLPAGMVTFEGTCASLLLDASETVTPAVGAAVVRYTVPVLLLPPVTELGDAVM